MRNSIIQLDDYYSIETDPLNWILKYEKQGGINPKTGEPKTTKDEWYFPNMNLCFKRYLNESLKSNDSIESILVSIENLEKTIDEKIKMACEST